MDILDPNLKTAYVASLLMPQFGPKLPLIQIDWVIPSQFRMEPGGTEARRQRAYKGIFGPFSDQSSTSKPRYREKRKEETGGSSGGSHLQNVAQA